MTESVKTVVQCDFDGTVTIEDGSFTLLDVFSEADWRPWFHDYEEGGMSVGRFNAMAFKTIRADRESLLKVIRRAVTLRPGFAEMVAYCRSRGFRFVIVSNGLRFYIDEVLQNAGLSGVEVHAAETDFDPGGLKVHYRGPDGNHLDEDFKLAYADVFLDEGYRVIYIGNGTSDMAPARKCHHVLATESLLRRCRRENLPCVPFQDHYDVIHALESL